MNFVTLKPIGDASMPTHNIIIILLETIIPNDITTDFQAITSFQAELKSSQRLYN